MEHGEPEGTPARRTWNNVISVAIPVFNEAEVLPHLLSRLRRVLDSIHGGPHEIVFVNDGSSDDTLAILEAEAREDPRLLVIALARNFGHQAALTAALAHTTGDVIVVMDADLQDAPEAIPILLEKYGEGYDVVYAQRVGRKEGLLLRSCYFLFYRVVAALADVRLPLDSGDFALMSRKVVDQLNQAPEHHRYLRGLRTWVGFRQIGVPVERAERHVGRSKYSFIALLKLAFDGIFAFSTAPLRAAALVGGFAVLGSACYALYAIIAKLVLQESTRGFTALIVSITFLAGVQLLFLGVIGEYLGRVYEEVKARPLYIVDRVIGRRTDRSSEPTQRGISIERSGGREQALSPNAVQGEA
jgi:dolichol-phosphate mannosyltransferase